MKRLICWLRDHKIGLRFKGSAVQQYCQRCGKTAPWLHYHDGKGWSLKPPSS